MSLPPEADSLLLPGHPHPLWFEALVESIHMSLDKEEVQTEIDSIEKTCGMKELVSSDQSEAHIMARVLRWAMSLSANEDGWNDDTPGQTRASAVWSCLGQKERSAVLLASMQEDELFDQLSKGIFWDAEFQTKGLTWGAVYAETAFDRLDVPRAMRIWKILDPEDAPGLARSLEWSLSPLDDQNTHSPVKSADPAALQETIRELQKAGSLSSEFLSTHFPVVLSCLRETKAGVSGAFTARARPRNRT